MAEVTIPISAGCASVLPDHGVDEARRQLPWYSVIAATEELRDALDGGGASDQRPAELRAAAEKVKGLADDLATANEQARSANG
jgi:hypothetical protein